MADKIASFIKPIRRYAPRLLYQTRDTNPSTPPEGEGPMGNQFRDIPLDIATRATHNGGGTREVPDLTF